MLEHKSTTLPGRLGKRVLNDDLLSLDDLHDRRMSLEQLWPRPKGIKEPCLLSGLPPSLMIGLIPKHVHYIHNCAQWSVQI